MSQRLTLVVVLAGVLLVAGCATTNHVAMERALYVQQHPDLSEQMADAILNGQIMVGMTKEMVQTAWGKPVRCEAVDCTKLKPQPEDTITERWIYGNYFVGGTITNLYFDDEGTLVRYEVRDESTHANTSSLTMKKSDENVKIGSDGSLEKHSGSRQ